MPSKKPILNFVIDPDELKRIDDFRFRYWFNSRAEAVKWLISLALDIMKLLMNRFKNAEEAAEWLKGLVNESLEREKDRE